ncbi:MAG TPA: flagellar basal body rod protein FlgB [Sulfuricurvum sp.]|nr:MAG: flagellar basal body rod protein FlgB [Campylobacterales bacterium 16-40-21]OZA02702.1 MAG: flagellar basal body rod protein FlgB [Sulfuricurvum sp. 17-40-25]HQS66757.1 flagellar basal body rod protein FlgB [Sulfuricurvum sp.]HQT36638.1 flagellar basal body rod protein FlgB [Sulfuricurvum sp.]
MSINISRAHELMKSAMDYRAARQDMIASNIANADTPFYRPRDIRFEETLAKQSAEVFADKSQELQMTHTNGAHLNGAAASSDTKPTTFFRDGHMARNDGNSVDLDVESSEMAKNSMMFNALTAALKKDSMLFKSVIDASSKTA